jgi:hypothetical protein
MGKIKIRIEPITSEEALQRDKRLIEFLTDNDRLNESSWAGNYRRHLDEVNESVTSILKLNF